MKQHNCFNIDNNQKCYLSSNIRMISEGSCDTEDWNNDAENPALTHSIENSDFIYFTI